MGEFVFLVLEFVFELFRWVLCPFEYKHEYQHGLIFPNRVLLVNTIMTKK